MLDYFFRCFASLQPISSLRNFPSIFSLGLTRKLLRMARSFWLDLILAIFIVDKLKGAEHSKSKNLILIWFSPRSKQLNATKLTVMLHAAHWATSFFCKLLLNGMTVRLVAFNFFERALNPSIFIHAMLSPFKIWIVDHVLVYITFT